MIGYRKGVIVAGLSLPLVPGCAGMEIFWNIGLVNESIEKLLEEVL